MATLTTTDDNIRLSYISKQPLSDNRGRPTLIFLHGWCANALEWLSFAEALQARFHVVCWNARGHGREPIPANTDMSLQRMAADLEQLIRTEAPAGAVLVGHSMGALTAWAWLQRYGSKMLKGLCIIDQSPCLLTTEEWRHGIYGDFDAQANRSFIDNLRQDFATAVTRLICCRPGSDQQLPDSSYHQRLYAYLQGLPAEPLIRCWESLTAADLRDVLPAIDAPTVLMYGDRSQFYGPEVARWVHRQIPDSQLIRFSEADHSPHAKECDAMIERLASFAESLGSASTERLSATQ